MENAGYIALSRQTALWRQMDQVANNIANVNTAGFKSEQMLFTDYVAKVRTDRSLFRDKVAYTQDFGTVRDLSEGAFNATGNSFDVAIKGEGYFTVEDMNGDRFYTRNGHFKLDADGQLVTTSGELLISEAEQPIIMAPNEREITVARDGTVSTENGPVGRLKLATFEDEREMKRAGNGLYSVEGMDPQPVENPHLVQGMLEGSNVNPVLEMTRMIDVQRSYEQAQKMIDNEHERRRSTIQAYAKSFS